MEAEWLTLVATAHASNGGVILYTVFYPWFALVMIWFMAAYLDRKPPPWVAG